MARSRSARGKGGSKKTGTDDTEDRPRNGAKDTSKRGSKSSGDSIEILSSSIPKRTSTRSQTLTAPIVEKEGNDEDILTYTQSGRAIRSRIPSSGGQCKVVPTTSKRKGQSDEEEEDQGEEEGDGTEDSYNSGSEQDDSRDDSFATTQEERKRQQKIREMANQKLVMPQSSDKFMNSLQRDRVKKLGNAMSGFQNRLMEFKIAQTLTNAAMDSDEDEMGTGECPTTVEGMKACPFCRGPMPETPSIRLRNEMQRWLNRYHAKGGQMTIGSTSTSDLCRMHENEAAVIPLGKKCGWPESLDCDQLRKRVQKHKRLRKIMAERIADPQTSDWFKKIKENRMQKGRAADGAMHLFSSLDQCQAGYYGEQGWETIQSVLSKLYLRHKQPEYNLEKLAQQNNGPFYPLSASDFLERVLVPEATCMLIRDDEQARRQAKRKSKKVPVEEVTIKEAQDICKQSNAYGIAMFPIQERQEGDDDDALSTHSSSLSEMSENESITSGLGDTSVCCSSGSVSRGQGSRAEPIALTQFSSGAMPGSGLRKRVRSSDDLTMPERTGANLIRPSASPERPRPRPTMTVVEISSSSQDEDELDFIRGSRPSMNGRMAVASTARQRVVPSYEEAAVLSFSIPNDATQHQSCDSRESDQTLPPTPPTPPSPHVVPTSSGSFVDRMESAALSQKDGNANYGDETDGEGSKRKSRRR